MPAPPAVGTVSGVELRRLRYFVAVAEDLHFRRAAERMHVTPPVISEQVRKLEAELGVVLLRRSSHDVGLTAAGAALLRQARVLLLHADRLEGLARSGAVTAEHLRVGHPADVLPQAVARALAAARRAGEDLTAAFETAPPNLLLDAVREGRLDVAVVPLPARVADLRCTEVGVETAALAVADDAAPAAASLDEAARGAVAVLRRDVDPAFFDTVVAALRTRDLPPPAISCAATPEQLLLEVAATGVPAIVPGSTAARCGVDGVELRSLGPAAPRMRVVLASRPQDAGAGLAAFLAAVARPPQRRAAVRTVGA